ncbi:hypothetical protein KDH_79570 [Dictyobacter sp. S3.2.2.5]|uniref:Uncharacterized protein n=1 Tax=Dictyobacter halimunensis TaxID=3026934 RepID=A0ABQ6G8J6_9CHLR|nr:hypothetical protein KDH_79570 [Dictyobacter sp. S3.2.2.5]
MSEQEAMQSFAQRPGDPAHRGETIAEGQEPEDSVPVCENPGCGMPITIVPGHRRRKYCSDACKSNAFRLRAAEAERLEQERQSLEAEEQRRQQLRQLYGEDLLPQTIEFLRGMERIGYNSLTVEAIAATLRTEINRISAAAPSQHQNEDERADLAQAMMELGDPDYHSIIVEYEGQAEFVVLGGHASWQGFAQKASRAHLRAIYDMYIAPLEQRRGAR